MRFLHYFFLSLNVATTLSKYCATEILTAQALDRYNEKASKMVKDWVYLTGASKQGLHE